MLKDDELDAIYENKPTRQEVYANHLKKNTEQTGVFLISTACLCPDSKGNKDRSIKILVKEPKVITSEDRRYDNGEFWLIFPKITAGYMFAEADIDIRDNDKEYKITFIIKSQKQYQIITKESQYDIFE